MKLQFGTALFLTPSNHSSTGRALGYSIISRLFCKQLQLVTDVPAWAVGRSGCARLRIRLTSPTLNASTSKAGCWPAPSGFARPLFTAQSSTPSCICSARVVRGACCPLTLAAGARPTVGSTSGVPTALGNACNTGCAARWANAITPRRHSGRQSAKVGRLGCAAGYDAGIDILYCKRHVFLDTLGLLLALIVGPSQCAGPGRGAHVAEPHRWMVWSLAKIWADGSSTVRLVSYDKRLRPHLQAASGHHSPMDRGAHLRLAHHHRRLVRDYGRKHTHSEAFLLIAMPTSCLNALPQWARSDLSNAL